jgi:hypothetical protein
MCPNFACPYIVLTMIAETFLVPGLTDDKSVVKLG